MSNFSRDFESEAEYRRRLWLMSEEHPLDIEDAKAEAKLAAITVKPGWRHARNAEAIGAEDEYSNAMKRRYGGEW